MERKSEDNGQIGKWGRIKDKIFPILIRKEEEKLEKAVWSRWQDLAVCYAIRFPQGEGYFQLLVTRRMMGTWGIKQSDMQEQAMKNMRRDGYRVVRIQEMLKEMMRDLKGREDMEEFMGIMASDGWGSMYDTDNMANDMVVVTNRLMRYGASVVLDGELLKKIAGEDDMYILPSSRHEMLLLPAREGIRKKDLEDMVQIVNQNEVPTEDRLSDHVYCYNAGKGRVEM